MTARRKRKSSKGRRASVPQAKRAASRRRAKSSDWLWWRNGVVYQIYPRSFMDSDGNGIGDLEGIRQRLDHLAWLGVDALWISPCFPSPMADFGYDVSDYCDIDPRFGKLADFDRLLSDAHARGLRVLLDLVPNHSSSAHPWFQESRASRTNPKRDWYVWRDPKPDGAPPNNWLAVFGGPAWTLDPASGQYYLHSFLPEQPDLNWRNPAVVRAMHDVVRFWFERGVDGFRIDVVHRIAKDPKLRDNPVRDPAQGFGGQLHLHDENHADVHRLLRGLRRLADRYPERAYVGEVYLMNPAEVARYCAPDELHLGFNFSFLHSPWSAASFRRETERFQKYLGRRGWPNHVLSSHDAPRHASRYDHPVLGDARSRLAALMLLTLRGTPFLYQGEEIGMRNVAVPEARLQDPLAWRLHPKLSRDPSRTPLPWQPGPGAGFTSGEPWLPLGADADVRNVAAQRAEPASLLHFYHEALALRRRTPALHAGSYAALRAPQDVFAFERRAGRQRARVALNFGDAPATVSLGSGRVAETLSSRPGAAPLERLGRVTLGPCEGLVAVLAAERR